MRKSRTARLATQPEALHDRPGGHTVKVRYFTSGAYHPPALLRRVEFVDEITEDQARAFAADAFD